MLLSQSKTNSRYRVISLSMPSDAKRRFEILGMVGDCTLEVIQAKRSGARIIRLRGSRYALGPAFCQAIEVCEL